MDMLARGMKIAVCMKEVPDAAAPKRLDPSTHRIDRSVDGALNDFDTHALEAALVVKDAAPDTEVVVVSMGPERAGESMRKALAMGADRVVRVTDDAAAGSDLVATSAVLAKALERESADLIYNLVVLWVSAGVQPQDVWDEMARREQLMGIAEKMPKLHKVAPAPAAPAPVRVPASRRKVVALDATRARKRR